VTYCDTSFLLPLYLAGDYWHSKAVAYHRRHLLGEAFFFNPWHRWELRHNVRVVLSEKGDQDKIFRRVQEDLESGKLRHLAFSWAAIFEKADELSATHAGEVSAGTVDFWHVSFALQMKANRFLTFDKQQLELARRALLDAPDLLRSGRAG
jgi:predicted nucleic acid-binding protein